MENKLILVVNDFDNDLELVTNRITETADNYDQIRILHSQEISQEIRDLFPRHVNFEFLSKGVLPTLLVRTLSPVINRISAIVRRLLKPFGFIFYKFRYWYRLYKWKIRRLWAAKDFYIRKSFAYFFKLCGLIKQFILKAMRLLIVFSYKMAAPIIAFILSIFIEWPIAILISCIPSKSDLDQDDINKQSMFSKIRKYYLNFTYKIYMKRLKRIQKQHESADFEYINLVNSDS